MINRILFDHESDPQENVNIAGYPEMQATANSLSEQIRKFMITIRVMEMLMNYFMKLIANILLQMRAVK